jgi:general secretion pathway protein G
MILRNASRRRSDRLGFTLMEVLVVVAILVVLAGVSSIAVFSYLDNAKIDRARSDVQAIENALKSYKLRFSNYPDSLDQLLTPPNGKPFFDSQESILDPWGQRYQYNPQGPNNGGRKPDVWTNTPDGSEQIGNWMSTVR